MALLQQRGRTPLTAVGLVGAWLEPGSVSLPCA